MLNAVDFSFYQSSDPTNKFKKEPNIVTKNFERGYQNSHTLEQKKSF